MLQLRLDGDVVGSETIMGDVRLASLELHRPGPRAHAHRPPCRSSQLTKEEKKAKKEAKRAAAAAAAEEAEKAAKKAEKKEKKDKKRAADDEAEAAPAKKSKSEMTEEERKAAKKAKKAAKAAAEAGAGEAAPAEPAAAAPDTPAAAGSEARVFVGNLPFKITEDWLKDEFKDCGELGEITWLTHSDTGRFKGAVFISMADAAAANKAIEANGRELEGRPMKVELATPRRSASYSGAGGATPIGAPSDPGEPSATIFMGNLPWDIDEDTLKKVLAPCGEVQRIHWLEKDGEFKGVAFVDFNSVEEATKAVALAGTPLGSKGRPVKINFGKGKTNAKSDDKWGGEKKQRVERPYKPAGPKPDGCYELFCGNLPWSIDDDKIKAFFAKAGATVTETRWLNDKETGEFKGIGFVGFGTTEEVDKAVALGGEQLEGRPIRLDYAGAKPEKKKEGAWQGGW